MLKTYEKGKAVQLSENFKSTEFDCHGFGCCRETKVSLQLVDILQSVRNHFGKAVTINSGYRCKTRYHLRLSVCRTQQGGRRCFKI